MFAEFITVTGDTSKLKISIDYPNCESGESPPYFILRIFHKAERYRYSTFCYVSNIHYSSFVVRDEDDHDDIIATIVLKKLDIMSEYNIFSNYFRRDKETEELIFTKNIKHIEETIING